MVKKVSYLSVAGAFLALSLSSPAQEAAPPPPLDAHALGVLEGLLNFCGKVNPQSADKYKEINKSVTKDLPAEKVSEMRGTDEYKDSADQMRKQLGSLSPKDASTTCKAQAK